MFHMPGRSHAGPLLPLDATGVNLRDSLRRDVEKLAGHIGPRNIFYYDALGRAADFLKVSLADAGYKVETQEYAAAGRIYRNIEAEKEGTTRKDEIVIVGAHYDSAGDCSGANDNATGAAAVLALARMFSDMQTCRTLRFVEFANEEPPFFQSPDMGSLRYAGRCRQRNEKIVGMICLETIGYYSDEQGSQKYPFPFGMFYPSTGNFIAFVGNMKSGPLVRECVSAFREHAKFPSEGAAITELVPEIALSDQWSFWKQGYPALMVTDTAPFRYSHYHADGDTPDKVQYDKLARVVLGLRHVIEAVGSPK